MRRRFVALFVFSLCLLLGSSFPGSAQTSSGKSKQKAANPPPAQAQAPETGAPVMLGDRTLFHVQERMYSFSPEDRATAIGDRLTNLARDPFFSPDQLRLEEGDSTTDIIAGDRILMSVTERDATRLGRPRLEIAQEYLVLFQQAIRDYKSAYGWRTLAREIGYTLLTTLALYLLLRLLAKLFRKLRRIVVGWRETHIRSLYIQKVELLTAEQITRMLLALLKLSRGAVTLLLLYVYLSVTFSFFPQTRSWADILVGYALRPILATITAIVNYLPDLFTTAVILVASYYLMRFVHLIFREIERGRIVVGGFYPEWADPTYKIVRLLIAAMTLVVVFPYLPGATSPAFRGVSIFLGVLVSLGSTSAVANMVAGVILTYMRPFHIGDRVRIAETVGDVMERTLLVTRIRTIKNVEIAIANAMVLGSHIVNYSTSNKESGLILHTAVTIGYDAPWRQVHQLLIDAAVHTEGVLEQPPPFVLQTDLQDFYVRYEINAYTDQPNRMAMTYSLLHQNIQDAFNQAGVEITSPHYAALRDGNTIAIPESYRPEGYETPAFQVRTAKGKGVPAATAPDGNDG